jgi:hypothetical protein
MIAKSSEQLARLIQDRLDHWSALYEWFQRRSREPLAMPSRLQSKHMASVPSALPIAVRSARLAMGFLRTG